ncbi:MAG: hypothetical protein ACI4QT_02580 [Kiritimatiellia bacterium]
MRNQAFAYIKPHAMGSQAVVSAIGTIFENAGVRVTGMRRIEAPELAQKGYFDLQNGSIARFSLLENLLDFAPFSQAFEQAFGEDWNDVCAENRFFPSQQAAAKLGFSPDDLLLYWCFAGSIQFADGLYIGRLDLAELEERIHPKEDGEETTGCCHCGHDHHHHGHSCHPQKPVYVVNGFYPAQRQPYLNPTGPGVQSFFLDFDCDWTDFNDVIIGDEDPAGALEESIRGFLYDRSDALGFRIDRFDNILHASGSAFEALCDKFCWGASRKTDPLWKLLSSAKAFPMRKLGPALLALRNDENFCASVLGLDPQQTLEPLLDALAKMEKRP